ncbi:hypothetical protein BOX15_Mlig004596g4 [Macrostomum lignano]|uniref:RING-type domain-containing protein n=1 Tax=Macrostomum lignano TaxID=282301 RepID=A0A267FYX7_9PLAT|nr:hypothetical protein BOX15_Mlig004596g4 [Macrostomum lignano]
MDASFVSCPLCSQLFTEPRELPCRHTVCLRCFRSLPADCSGGRSCPVCGQVCAVPPEQLTPDAKTSQMVQMYRMMTAAGGTTPKEPQQLGTEAACSQLNCSSRSVSACGPVSRMSVCESHLQSELEQLRSKLSRLTESHRRLEPARKRIVSAKWRLEHDVQTVEELLGEMQEMLGQTKNSLCAEIAAIQEQVSGCLQNLERVDRQVARAQAADAEQQTNEIFKAKSLLKNIDCEQPVIDCPNLQRRLHSLTLLLQAELSKLCYCSEPAVTASLVLSLNADVVHKSPYRSWLLSNRVERSTQRHCTRRLNSSTSSRGGASSSASAFSRNSATAFTDAVASTAGKTGTLVAFGFPQSIESNSKVPWFGVGQTNQSAQVPAETDEQVGVLPIRMSNSTGLQSCSGTTRLTVCSNTTGFFIGLLGQVTSDPCSNPLPAECLVVLRSDSLDSLLFIDCENSDSRFYCKLTGWDQKPNDLCWVPGGPRLALASGRGPSGASAEGREQLSFTARTGFGLSFGTSSDASVGVFTSSVEAPRKASASKPAATFAAPRPTSSSVTAATSFAPPAKLASTPAATFSFAPAVTSASTTAATFSFAPAATSASTTAATFSFAPAATSASTPAAPAVVSVALADLSGCIVRSRKVDQLQRLTGLTANADKVFVAGVSAAHARLSVVCFSAESLELQSVIELSELPTDAASAGVFGISLCKSGLLFACPMSSRLLHHCLETGVTSAFSDEKLGEGSAFCADDRGLVFVARRDYLKVHLPDGRLLQTVESSPSAPVSCIFASSDLIFVSHLQSTVARVYSRGNFFK